MAVPSWESIVLGLRPSMTGCTFSGICSPETETLYGCTFSGNTVLGTEYLYGVSILVSNLTQPLSFHLRYQATGH